MLEWVPRDVTIPIRYWGFGIGIGGIDRYWYWYCVVFLFLIPFVLVFTTEDFPTRKPLMGRDIDFPQSLRNPNPVSAGQNYALSFLTKEALLGQDIDFPQGLPKDCRGRVNRIFFRFLGSLHHAEHLGSNLVQNQYLGPKVLN